MTTNKNEMTGHIPILRSLDRPILNPYFQSLHNFSILISVSREIDFKNPLSRSAKGLIPYPVKPYQASCITISKMCVMCGTSNKERLTLEKKCPYDLDNVSYVLS